MKRRLDECRACKLCAVVLVMYVALVPALLALALDLPLLDLRTGLSVLAGAAVSTGACILIGSVWKESKD